MAICPTCHADFPPEIAVCPTDGASLRQVERSSELGLAATTPNAHGGVTSKRGSESLVGVTLADRFKIVRRLGEGGMGAVYEAQHAVIGRTVAIKVLHDRYAERPEIAARLMNEARLASSIHHDHIVDVFDVGETADGRPFVVMELLDGESLAEVIRRDGPLAERDAIDLALQVADALGAAHAKGIIHRDVKPENVFLVQRNGNRFAKVVDFGISKAVRVNSDGDDDGEPATPRLTQTGMVLGTPLYMSPEQARGEDDLDHRIDVYALGVILYECLTGVPPFAGTNYLGIISQVLTEPPPSPRERCPDLSISEGIERVVLRALSKPRDDRYPSTEAMAVDLRRALAGEAIAPPAASRSAGAPPKGRRAALLAAVGAVVAVGAIVIGVVVSRAALLAANTVGEVAPPAPPPGPSPPARPPESVVFRFRGTDGAEVFDGARRLGAIPGSIELPRGDGKLHLTFRKEGFEPNSADMVPSSDQSVEIVLQRARRAGHPRPATKRDRAAKPGGPEQLPAGNPYGQKPARLR